LHPIIDTIDNSNTAIPKRRLMQITSPQKKIRNEEWACRRRRKTARPLIGCLKEVGKAANLESAQTLLADYIVQHVIPPVKPPP